MVDEDLKSNLTPFSEAIISDGFITTLLVSGLVKYLAAPSSFPVITPPTERLPVSPPPR